MDKETLLALGEFLQQSITFTQGPRVGMILPQSFKTEGCGHTLRKTIEWLESNGHDVISSMRWLKERGGDCDCKIITNIVLRIDDEI